MPDRGSHRVLCVDDDAAERQTLAEILEEAGYLVSVVPGGAQAAEAVRTFRPHLILADVWAPAQDDFALVTTARQARIPFLLLATTDSPETDAAARYFGAIGVLRKPPDAGAVVARIDGHFQDCRRPDAAAAPGCARRR